MIEINLLPKEYQKRKFKLSLEKNALYVIFGGIGVLAVLAAYTIFFLVLPAGKVSATIEKYKAEAERFAPQTAKIDSLNQLKQAILTRMSAISLLDRNRTVYIDLLSDLGSRVTDYLWLNEFKQLISEAPQQLPKQQSMGEEEPGRQSAKPAQAAAPTTQPQRAILRGKSFSLNSIATFIARLKNSPYLANIELTSVRLVEEKNAEAYEFVINGTLILEENKQESTGSGTASGQNIAGTAF